MLERLELLIGNNTKRIKNKTVMILGLGGVGGHAYEVLLRSGVGTIIVLDNDVFDKTNLNRQILSNINNIGQEKVLVAKKRKDEINPDCKLITINKYLTEDNIDLLRKHKIDYLIDAIDTLKTKKAVIKYCLNNNIKFITVTGTGNRMDPTKIIVTDIRNTNYDPVARELRSFIKKEKINKKIPVIFSKEQPVRKGTVVGSNAFVPAVAGITAAYYIINEIIKEEN